MGESAYVAEGKYRGHGSCAWLVHGRASASAVCALYVAYVLREWAYRGVSDVLLRRELPAHVHVGCVGMAWLGKGRGGS